MLECYLQHIHKRIARIKLETETESKNDDKYGKLPNHDKINRIIQWVLDKYCSFGKTQHQIGQKNECILAKYKRIEQTEHELEV